MVTVRLELRLASWFGLSSRDPWPEPVTLRSNSTGRHAKLGAMLETKSCAVHLAQVSVSSTRKKQDIFNIADEDDPSVPDCCLAWRGSNQHPSNDLEALRHMTRSIRPSAPVTAAVHPQGRQSARTHSPTKGPLSPL
ncbi:hypothetical protein RRG08_034237 [Elysia crispata]|uniref:Uncharacterized protein n=1 Tax=Elysia crispata TaxID=231223 RepID=A0AAE1A1X2_9GAST|nr:hypothetical protein RRG08_034237 [Elysia crispata]